MQKTLSGGDGKMAAEICLSKNSCDRYNIALNIQTNFSSFAHRFGNAMHSLTSVILQTIADDIYVNSLLKRKKKT